MENVCKQVALESSSFAMIPKINETAIFDRKLTTWDDLMKEACDDIEIRVLKDHTLLPILKAVKEICQNDGFFKIYPAIEIVKHNRIMFRIRQESMNQPKILRIDAVQFLRMFGDMLKRI